MDTLTPLLAADTLKLLAITLLLMVALPFLMLIRRKGRTVLSLGTDNGTTEESMARLKVIEEEQRRHRKDLYEWDGALRRGDHDVRNSVSALFLRETEALGKKIDALAGEITGLKIKVAEIHARGDT